MNVLVSGTAPVVPEIHFICHHSHDCHTFLYDTWYVGQKHGRNILKGFFDG